MVYDAVHTAHIDITVNKLNCKYF